MKEKAKVFLKFFWCIPVLVALLAVLFVERRGVISEPVPVETKAVNYVEAQKTADVVDTKKTLVVTYSEYAECSLFSEQAEYVLNDMKIPYDIMDVTAVNYDTISNYTNIVVTFCQLYGFGENMAKIDEWVKNGGHLMNITTYSNDDNLKAYSQNMGINSLEEGYGKVNGLHIADGFMIAGDYGDFYFADREEYEFSLKANLSENCKVYISSAENNIPLLWEHEYGAGKYVVTNMSLVGKISRGFIAAAYSVMDEVCVYPVINGSVYYIDDFPSPVPGGEGKYIQEDYGLDIANFYSNIWWRDILQLEKKYNIIHTALIIEDYSDIVKPPFTKMEAIARFRFFGNMLLNNGGELGYHGYNHMPLVTEDYDYQNLYDAYNKWASKEDMEGALTELKDFCTTLFPSNEFKVYVPPSNIIDETGIEAIREVMPEVDCIASTYMPGNCAYSQEFEVLDNGIVQAPRITSGAILDKDFTYMLMLSEFNMHYVQSHFLHPDDVLDEDRGAKLRWKKMIENIDEYIDFVTTYAPDLRNLRGSDFTQSIRQYCGVSVKRDITQNGISLQVGGLAKEAYFMMRVNDGKVGNVEGGSVYNVTGNLYILTATQENVTVEIKK